MQPSRILVSQIQPHLGHTSDTCYDFGFTRLSVVGTMQGSPCGLVMLDMAVTISIKQRQVAPVWPSK